MLMRSLIRKLIPGHWIGKTWNFRHYSLEEHRAGRLYFSQCGEDAVLRSIFLERVINGPPGFYVDVGAYDPFHYSNTHLFYRQGWRGINIEPNPASYNRFLKFRRRDINIQSAVAEKPDQMTLYINGPRTSLTEAETLEQNTLKSIQVPCLPLATILAKHLPDPRPEIDFMDVDCEGFDMVVLRSNDWTRFRPKVILAEDLSFGADASLLTYMQGINYQFFCRLYHTCLFVSEEFNSERPSGT